MATINLTEDNFNETIENNGIVLVDFLGDLVRALPRVRTHLREGV